MVSFIGQSPSRIAEHQRFAAALQQGWRVPFGPLGALTAPLIKSEFDFLSHRNSRGPPALATATHGPTGIVPSRHAGDESSPRRGCIGTVTYPSTFQTSAFTFCTSDAVPHHPRSCSAFAGRDSLRSVGHDTDAAGFSCRRLCLAVH